MLLDLTGIAPHSGRRYQDTYGGWLDIFKTCATLPEEETLRVRGAPWSWVPLLWHLGAVHASPPREVFEQSCPLVKAVLSALPVSALPGDEIFSITRTQLEVLCAFRPETVDALWKCDMQWKTGRKPHWGYREKEFLVTTTSAYQRTEVLEYEKVLRQYRLPKNKSKVILVPCDADKPYPSPLHSEVMKLIPDESWYIACVTGVLGVVPQDLWNVMPHYDAGIPNEWRVMRALQWYFQQNPHDIAICYNDFNTTAIRLACQYAQQRVVCVVEETRYDYEDLTSQENLGKLYRTLEDFR